MCPPLYVWRAGKKQDALPASLRLGASLVMLLSKSATELRRTVEQDGEA